MLKNDKSTLANIVKAYKCTMCKKCVHVCNNIAFSGYLNDFPSNCYYKDSGGYKLHPPCKDRSGKELESVDLYLVINAVENSKYFFSFFS